MRELEASLEEYRALREERVEKLLDAARWPRSVELGRYGVIEVVDEKMADDAVRKIAGLAARAARSIDEGEAMTVVLAPGLRYWPIERREPGDPGRIETAPFTKPARDPGKRSA